MAFLQRPPGTFDVLPDGSPKLEPHASARGQAYVVEVARRVLERAGAQYIATPMFEEAELVKRGVGGSTDIVRKEMFTVFYQGEHGGYVMRPEGTAPIVRAYLQNGLKQLGSPLRLWTWGAMFRAERHQQGRYRQFHQMDYEVIGSADPIVDAEAIALMVEAFAQLGIRGTRVKLGSVGDPEDRARYNQYLRDLFGAHEASLSDDSRDRLARNPMRILDSKDKGDQALLAQLQPRPMLDFLGEEAGAHFQAVRGFLDAWSVPYDVDPTIVRGLDYYRRTAWEIHHENIGAKSALGGGGRYDGLAEELGGPHTPAVGWAFGIERALLALEQEGVAIPGRERPLLYVAALDAELVAHAAHLAFRARESGIAEYAIAPRKPSKAVQEALKRGARYVAFIGSEEVARGFVSIKDLDTSVQIPVPNAVLGDILSGRLSLVSSNVAEIVLAHLASERHALNAAHIAQLVFASAWDAIASRSDDAWRAFRNQLTHEKNVLTDEHGGTANIPGPRDLAALEKQVRSIWNFFDLEAQ